MFDELLVVDCFRFSAKLIPMAEMNLRRLNLDDDWPALADFLNTVRIQKVSAERLREREINRPPGRLRRTMVAVDAYGQICGYSMVAHRPAAEAGRYYLDVAVGPDYRRRGLGAVLYEEAYQFALDNDVRILDADVYDNCAYCLQFAEARGFAIDRHLFESVLDLQAFNPGQYAAVIAEVVSSGIRLFSLAEGGGGDELLRQLHAVNYQAVMDDPASHGTFPSFEDFQRMIRHASWFIPEGQILAAAGEQVIGLSAVGFFAEQNLFENMITGVLPAYRGRHIAQALKVTALRFAKSYGADRVRTHNDSQNAPMLAINRKLGYKPEVGEYRMVKRL